MIAAPPLSGCPLAKPATQNWRWPSEGKGTTIGVTVRFIMDPMGCVAMLYHPGRKGPTPHRHKYTKECQRIVPSFPKPPRSSGVTIVGPTTAIATHNLAEPLYPSGSQHDWNLAVYQAPTSRRCGHARRRSTSTPRGQAQTTHTHSQGHRAVCLLRPTCP